MDYCFVRRDDETETVTVLLMNDRCSRAIQAWVVERKGPDLDAADVAQRALVGLRNFGHRGRVRASYLVTQGGDDEAHGG